MKIEMRPRGNIHKQGDWDHACTGSDCRYLGCESAALAEFLRRINNVFVLNEAREADRRRQEIKRIRRLP